MHQKVKSNKMPIQTEVHQRRLLVARSGRASPARDIELLKKNDTSVQESKQRTQQTLKKKQTQRAVPK